MSREDLEQRLEKIVPPPVRPVPVPQIGDMVHFYPVSVVLGAPLGEPIASVVTYVHQGGFVAIQCLGYDEIVRHRGVPFSPTPRAGFWSWRPR